MLFMLVRVNPWLMHQLLLLHCAECAGRWTAVSAVVAREKPSPFRCFRCFCVVRGLQSVLCCWLAYVTCTVLHSTGWWFGGALGPWETFPLEQLSVLIGGSGSIRISYGLLQIMGGVVAVAGSVSHCSAGGQRSKEVCAGVKCLPLQDRCSCGTMLESFLSCLQRRLTGVVGTAGHSALQLVVFKQAGLAWVWLCRVPEAV